jgi:hypothetical protein
MLMLMLMLVLMLFLFLLLLLLLLQHNTGPECDRIVASRGRQSSLSAGGSKRNERTSEGERGAEDRQLTWHWDLLVNRRSSQHRPRCRSVQQLVV